MVLNKLLLVDDEEDIRKVAMLSLSRIGKFEVECVAGGEDAIAAAEARPPDMIILDIMMPGMDGLAVLRKLLENPATASIPVLFMTAKAQAHEISAYLAAGAKGVVEKPFDPMKLPALVREIAAGL